MNYYAENMFSQKEREEAKRDNGFKVPKDLSNEKLMVIGKITSNNRPGETYVKFDRPTNKKGMFLIRLGNIENAKFTDGGRIVVKDKTWSMNGAVLVCNEG